MFKDGNQTMHFCIQIKITVLNIYIYIYLMEIQMFILDSDTTYLHFSLLRGKNIFSWANTQYTQKISSSNGKGIKHNCKIKCNKSNLVPLPEEQNSSVQITIQNSLYFHIKQPFDNTCCPWGRNSRVFPPTEICQCPD